MAEFRIIVVAGTLPSLVKVQAIVPALAKAGFNVAIAHTGHQFDSSTQEGFFADLELPTTDWDLGVGTGTHAVQTGTAGSPNRFRSMISIRYFAESSMHHTQKSRPYDSAWPIVTCRGTW